MRIILAEDKEAVAASLADALAENPRVLAAWLSSAASAENSSLRSRTRALRTVEEIGSEDLEGILSAVAADLDTYEAAALVNTACRVLNRIHDANPDVVRNLAGGIADSVNREEIGKTAQWLIPDLVEAARPVAAAVMPALIQGLAEMIRPAGGFESAEHEEAVKNLRAALTA